MISFKKRQMTWPLRYLIVFLMRIESAYLLNELKSTKKSRNLVIQNIGTFCE